MFKKISLDSSEYIIQNQRIMFKKVMVCSKSGLMVLILELKKVI